MLNVMIIAQLIMLMQVSIHLACLFEQAGGQITIHIMLVLKSSGCPAICTTVSRQSRYAEFCFLILLVKHVLGSLYQWARPRQSPNVYIRLLHDIVLVCQKRQYQLMSCSSVCPTGDQHE